MPMRRGPAVFFALGLAAATAAMAHEPPSRPGVDAPELAKPGPFGVGVRTIELVDPAQIDVLAFDPRNERAQRDRTLKVELWHPSPGCRRESRDVLGA
jgi:hypothetical protein